MHAIRWRSSRALTQILSYATTSRRQCLHWTPRTFGTSKPDPAETSDSSINDTQGTENGGAGGEDDVSPTNTGAARPQSGYNNKPGGRVSRARQRGQENGVAPASVFETRSNGALPPVEVPDWFLETNVRLNEELFGFDGQSDLIYLRDVTTKRVVASLPCYRGNQHGLRTSVSAGEEMLIHTDLPGTDLYTSSIILAEIAASISAGLSIPLSASGQSFPAAKTNLILYCPFDGFGGHLKEIVYMLARNLKADVLSMNAQDISELAGDYLSDPQEPESREHSWRNLVYDVQEEASQLRKISDNAHDIVNADTEVQDAEGPGLPARNASPLSNSPSISFHPIWNLGDLIKLTQSLKSTSQNHLGVPDHNARSSTSPLPGPYSSPSSLQWEDLKLSSLLECLLDTNRVKRQAGGLMPILGTKNHVDSREGVSDFKRGRTEENFPASYFGQERRAVETYLQSLMTKDEKPLFGMELSLSKPIDGKERCSGENNGPRLHADRAPLIVLIEDFGNLGSTFNGSRVLQKLEKIVRQKRSEGIPIMIIGTSSDDHHLSAQSDDLRSSIDRWQADMENSLYRTVVVPFLYDHSDATDVIGPPQTEMAEIAFTSLTASDAQNVTGNARSLHAMCRRVNANATPSSLPEFLRDNLSLRGGLLDFNDAHRLSVIARGLAFNVSSEEMHPGQFAIAVALILWSDKIKAAWVSRRPSDLLSEGVKSEGQPPTHLKSVTDMQPKISAKSRIKTIEKTATHHEKRLLTGVIDPQNLGTSFASVHASSETIEALDTLTTLSLKRPDAFTYGILASSKIPGLLLYGPPGTGKTLLAKAVAKESGATMLEVSGGDIYDMYVGEGEKNVKAMFSLARKLSPCVVFIDEADAIFRTRGGDRSTTSHREIINQFLREWDGMSNVEESVFIMVATNRPFDLDDAVLRRLPRRILVDLPTQKDREAILDIHLKGENLDSTVDLVDLARRTSLYSGSDLKNLCVAAALACVRQENDLLEHRQQANVDESPSGSISVHHTAKADGQSAEDAKVVGEMGPPVAFRFPMKRTLCKHHFDKAIEEIGASISEDMSSLNAMKKFDERYGDRRGHRSRRVWGFGAGEGTEEVEDGTRVRK
ncbi:MAG: hypothetical protein M1821_003555 [Bathelium mastoideum]|nr:MAG: hypothetical protein M1821_003555 [Bathelium mastoideum]